VPKTGNRFVGPATIVGAGAEVAFQAKTGSGGAADVRFIDLDVSGFAQGIWCWKGTQVIGGRYHDNTRNGIGCGLEGGGVLIDGVEVDHNGSQADLGSGASGLKFAQGNGIVVRDSYIHDNLGNGVWCDVQCGDYTVIDNRIIHNYRKGVHYEKSGESDFNGISFVGSAYIARNVVQGNGWEEAGLANAGIMAVSSKNILIEDNVLGDNNSVGIRVHQDDRLSGDKHGWFVSNVVILDNRMNGDEIDGCNLRWCDLLAARVRTYASIRVAVADHAAPDPHPEPSEQFLVHLLSPPADGPTAERWAVAREESSAYAFHQPGICVDAQMPVDIGDNRTLTVSFPSSAWPDEILEPHNEVGPTQPPLVQVEALRDRHQTHSRIAIDRHLDPSTQIGCLREGLVERMTWVLHGVVSL